MKDIKTFAPYRIRYGDDERFFIDLSDKTQLEQFRNKLNN